jgi:hypothetical protein
MGEIWTDRLENTPISSGIYKYTNTLLWYVCIDCKMIQSTDGCDLTCGGRSFLVRDGRLAAIVVDITRMDWPVLMASQTKPRDLAKKRTYIIILYSFCPWYVLDLNTWVVLLTVPPEKYYVVIHVCFKNK